MDDNDLLDIPPFLDRRTPEENHKSDDVIDEAVPDVVCEGELIVSGIKYEAPVGKRYDLVDGKVVGSPSSRSAKATGETI